MAEQGRMAGLHKKKNRKDTPADMKQAAAEAAARFWNMETVIQHWWSWDPVQKRFVFEKTIEKPVED